MLEVSHISITLFGASLFLAVINYWSIIPICVMGFLYYRLACLYASSIPKLRLLEHNGMFLIKFLHIQFSHVLIDFQQAKRLSATWNQPSVVFQRSETVEPSD